MVKKEYNDVLREEFLGGEKLKKILENQQYVIVGKNSGVKICEWTKKSLRGEGVCWKEKFYGIKSHRCAEMSPAVMWCENYCLHCWRAIENNLGMKLNEYDEPEKIIEGIIEGRKKLLSGFGGYKDVDRQKLKEAVEPTLFTLSLSGEATIYPKLAELIKLIRKRGAVSFLVTNGLNPEKLKELEKKNALPTQLAISLNAGNKKLYDKWHRSLKKNAWEKLNESLELMKKLKGKTRRVIRMTLVKGDSKNKESQSDQVVGDSLSLKLKRPQSGAKEFSLSSPNNISNMTDDDVKDYAGLIKKAQPDFIHVKGFMSVGFSRKRFTYEQMPLHPEIQAFAKKLAKELKNEDYVIKADEERSRVVLIAKKGVRLKIDMKKV